MGCRSAPVASHSGPAIRTALCKLTYPALCIQNTYGAAVGQCCPDRLLPTEFRRQDGHSPTVSPPVRAFAQGPRVYVVWCVGHNRGNVHGIWLFHILDNVLLQTTTLHLGQAYTWRQMFRCERHHHEPGCFQHGVRCRHPLASFVVAVEA